MINISNPIIFRSFPSRYRFFVLLLIINFIFSWKLFAENFESTVGKETGFDIPRYVSLKVSEANMRRGPSLDHKIDWVYKRKNLPIKIIGEFRHWRKVEDFEGQTGWMFKSLFSGKNSGLHNFGYTCYMPKKIEIDQLLIKDTQLKDYDSLFIFSDFNPEMKNDKFKQIFPYNRTDVLKIREVKVRV